MEADLLEVAKSARKVWQDWPENAPETLEMEVVKAIRYVAYLRNTWAGRVYSQFQNSLNKADDEAKTAAIQQYKDNVLGAGSKGEEAAKKAASRKKQSDK